MGTETIKYQGDLTRKLKWIDKKINSGHILVQPLNEVSAEKREASISPHYSLDGFEDI